MKFYTSPYTFCFRLHRSSMLTALWLWGAFILPAHSVTQHQSILVLGDSLSAAYKLPAEQGWVSLLKARLKAQGKKVSVINGSISGATTAAGLQLLPSLLSKHKPGIVILELGANDGLQGKPLAYIRKNLSKLITLSTESGARVLLIGIRIPPNFGPAYTEPFFKQYEDLAKQHNLSRVPFLLEGVAGKPNLMMEDGLHPNAQAQAIILENVWPHLAQVLAIQ